MRLDLPQKWRCAEIGQRVCFRVSSDYDHVPFIELYSHQAVYERRLGCINHRLHHSALRAPPITIINKFRIARHQFVFQVGHLAVEGDGFDGPMRTQHDGAARGLIASTGFHADVTIFHQIQTPDTVLAT